MAKTNLAMPMPGADPVMKAATPLTAYSPGNLAHLTPAQRAKALKRSKNVKVTPAMLSTPPSPMT